MPRDVLTHTAKYSSGMSDQLLQNATLPQLSQRFQSSRGGSPSKEHFLVSAAVLRLIQFTFSYPAKVVIPFCLLMRNPSMNHHNLWCRNLAFPRSIQYPGSLMFQLCESRAMCFHIPVGFLLNSLEEKLIVGERLFDEASIRQFLFVPLGSSTDA